MPCDRPVLSALFQHGRAIGLGAVLAGGAILVIDWLTVLDQPGERIRESLVSDIGGAALVLTGAAILLTLRLQRGDAARFQREGIKTTARIDDIRLGFFGTDVTLSFQDQHGAAQTVTLRGSNLALRPGLAPGSTVGICHDPDNPRSLRFQDTLDTLSPPR